MFRKVSVVSFALVVLSICCAFTVRPKAQQQQTVMVVATDFPHAYLNKEPVKIVGLYLGDRVIESGQQVYTRAGNDWLKDLRVRVKNVSDQPIKTIVLNLKVGDRLMKMYTGRRYDLSPIADDP